MLVYKTFTFAAAHHLPNVPKDHKCSAMHGHTFTVAIYVRGPVQPKAGWVADFADIAGAFEPLRQVLDHACLNEVEGLENPTSERLAQWVWKRLHPALPGLCRVIIRESADAGCAYEGEDE